MKLGKIYLYTIALSMISSNFAIASDREVVLSSVQAPTAATYRDPSGNTTTTTMYQYNGPTIKTAAQQSAGNNNMGVILGVAGAAATGYGISQTCWQTPVNAMCYVYVAGLVASVGVTYKMLSARKQSQGTIEAVNTDVDAKLINPPAPDAPVIPPSVANDPGWQTAMDAKAKLEKQGWKFDIDKKKAVDPSGKTVSAGIVSSPSSLAASGASPDMIKQYQDTMNKAAKAAEQKAKGADSTSMFADESGGGGGGSPKAASSADGAIGLNTNPSGGQSKLGINRDPAQVAGMKKDYNGSPIGVAGDSLFDMVDRRYQLHQQNGAFISP